MSKKKRYEILRYGCYPEDWTDNQTNKRLTSLEIEKICNRQSRQIKDLQSQLAISEKAFELACLTISKSMCPNGNWDTLKKDFSEEYKEQAKEMLENE